MERVFDVDNELQRQHALLLEHRVPSLLGIDEETLSGAVDRLRPALDDCAGSQRSPGHVPFVLVVSGGAATDMTAAEQLVPSLQLAGGSAAGVLDRNHGAQGLTPYHPIEEVGPPPASVYALVDVDRGEEFRGVPPEEALPVISERGRSPLTILEGIALVLLHPDVLEHNACFMLSGSRRGDRRVPALWISEKAPKLGWCWAGNPHSWLGVATAAARRTG